MRLLHAVALVPAFTFALAACASTPEPAPRAPPPPGAEPLDLTRPGVYTSGPWEYRFTVIAPGSKSEGSRGELSFDGQPVPEAALGDYYRTPWGDLAWAGDPETLWGEHGWMPRLAGAGGKQLAEPARQAGPKVMMMLVSPVKAADAKDFDPNAIDPWVLSEMRRLGHKYMKIDRAWFALSDQALSLHDTKNYGRLTARLALPRESSVLSVHLGGSEPKRVDLVRLEGTTQLMKHTLAGGIEPLDFYLAFRVDRAALGYRAPFEVNERHAGQTVEVRGAGEVVVVLPGDAETGNVWVVKSVDGNLQAAGEPQFVPDFRDGKHPHVGYFENLFRVTGRGTATVVLEYRRPWQTDQPAEKTFTVGLKLL